jgi:hypothetical protein
MARPRTIQDFYGFPDELFAVEYPAPGAPAFAEQVAEIAKPTMVGFDTDVWGQGAEDGGGRLVVASTLEQRVQVRHTAQGGVGDRPLLQRSAGAAGSGQSAPFGVHAHQGVGHGGPPRHMWARGASRPVFMPAFMPAFLLLSPNRIMAAAPSPGRSPRRRPPAATRRGAGQI